MKVVPYEPDNIVKEILENSRIAKEEERIFNIAISGGSSIKGILTSLRALSIDFENWNIVLVDERNVGIDSIESNTKMIKEYIPNSKITSFYKSTHIDLDHSLKIYNELKVIDIAIMGVGEDGHFASIFPGKKVGEEEVMTVNDSPKPPSSRITVTYNFFKKCKRSIFIIKGENKHHLLDTNEQLPFRDLEKFCPVEVHTDK